MVNQPDLFRASNLPKQDKKFGNQTSIPVHITLEQFKESAACKELHLTADEEEMLRTAITEGSATIEDWVTIIKAVRGK